MRVQSTIGIGLHNILPDLQGGAPGEYYHYTSAQQTTIANHLASTLNPHSVTLTQAEAAGGAITESAITDGTILARVASNETISGEWTFSSNQHFSDNVYLYFGSGDDTGLVFDGSAMLIENTDTIPNATGKLVSTVTSTGTSNGQSYQGARFDSTINGSTFVPNPAVAMVFDATINWGVSSSPYFGPGNYTGVEFNVSYTGATGWGGGGCTAEAVTYNVDYSGAFGVSIGGLNFNPVNNIVEFSNVTVSGGSSQIRGIVFNQVTLSGTTLLTALQGLVFRVVLEDTALIQGVTTMALFQLDLAAGNVINNDCRGVDVSFIDPNMDVIVGDTHCFRATTHANTEDAVGYWANVAGNTTAYAFKSVAGDWWAAADDQKFFWGAAADASISWDGTTLLIEADKVGVNGAAGTYDRFKITDTDSFSFLTSQDQNTFYVDKTSSGAQTFLGDVVGISLFRFDGTIENSINNYSPGGLFRPYAMQGEMNLNLSLTGTPDSTTNQSWSLGGLKFRALAQPVVNLGQVVGVDPNITVEVIGGNIFCYNGPDFATNTVDIVLLNYGLDVEAVIADDNTSFYPADATITNICARLRTNTYWNSLGTSYALYLDPEYDGQTPAGGFYGLYQANAAAYNYFQGSVGIGVNPPTTQLDVTGDVRFLVPDDGANAFRVLEGANAYIDIDTTNSAEYLKFGVLGTLVHLESSEIGFFNTAPTTQPTDIVALTDSTGGTPNNTLVAISGTGDDATLNDNFADLAAKVNGLRTRLRALGLMA